MMLRAKALIARHRKLIVALAGAVVTALTAVLGPDDQWVQIVVASLSALGVYSVPNAEPVA